MKKLIFLDTETTGLDDILDEPWEVAWIVRDLARGRDTEGSVQVHHNTERALQLPAKFKADYDRRYNPENAVPRHQMARILQGVFDVAATGPRPTLIGCVPSFDTTRLSLLNQLLDLKNPWHYQIKDLESIALGWMQGRLAAATHETDATKRWRSLVWDLVVEGQPISSNHLSKAIGIDPDAYDRHQALGDCRWYRDMWDAMFGAYAPYGFRRGDEAL